LEKVCHGIQGSTAVTFSLPPWKLEKFYSGKPSILVLFTVLTVSNKTQLDNIPEASGVDSASNDAGSENNTEPASPPRATGPFGLNGFWDEAEKLFEERNPRLLSSYESLLMASTQGEL
jgi:hypothetical protein